MRPSHPHCIWTRRTALRLRGAVAGFVRWLVPVLGFAVLLTVEPGLGLHAAEPRQVRVLTIFAHQRLLPANMVVDDSIRTTLAMGWTNGVEFYTEFLDVDRFPSAAQGERVAEFLRNKYAARPPDLVFAAGDPALAFLIKHRNDLLPGVPVVHCGVSSEGIPPVMPDSRMVGIPHDATPAETVRLALQLQPDLKQIYVIEGSPRPNPRALLPEVPETISVESLSGRSIPDLKRKLAALPEHSAVLYRTFFADIAGNVFTPRQVLEQIAPASSAPIYGYYDTYLGYGIVGGHMVTFEAVGRAAARIGQRILEGIPPAEAVRSESHQAVSLFDGAQLQRWNIPESRLPPGSLVRLRPPNLWRDYRNFVLAGAAIITLQSATIGALLTQRRRRRRAEVRARENELRIAGTAEQLRLLSGRLIHAQEEERRRIARDLHDDLNQRLALLSVELELLTRDDPATLSPAKLNNLGVQVRQLSADLHQLSHQLHPAKLDQLGLEKAVAGLCRDVAQQSHTTVEFEPGEVPQNLPRDLGLCVFRIAQESLHNAVRHSGGTRITVRLTAADRMLRLAVCDNGNGFEPTASGQLGGLGLSSMHERARLVRGTLQVNSGPGRGTAVELTVPLNFQESPA